MSDMTDAFLDIRKQHARFLQKAVEWQEGTCRDDERARFYLALAVELRAGNPAAFLTVPVPLTRDPVATQMAVANERARIALQLKTAAAADGGDRATLLFKWAERIRVGE